LPIVALDASKSATGTKRRVCALAIEDAGEDPDRWLLIGPDTRRQPS
jgi:hypothetical protein